MSPLALVMFFLWGVVPAAFIALLIRDGMARRRAERSLARRAELLARVEAAWRLPARKGRAKW